MRIVIVGAGVSGLTLGGFLAKRGYDVILLERASIPGGRARFQSRSGFKLDHGIHVVRDGNRGIIWSCLSKLGIKLELLQLEPEAVYYAPGSGFVELGVKSLVEMLSSLKLRNILNLFRNLARDGHDVIQANWRRSIHEWICSIGDSSKLREFMRLSSSLIVCPFLERASMGEFLDAIFRKLKLGFPRTGYPLGGFFQIPMELARFLESQGGKLMLRSKVEQILIDSGVALGVRTKSQRFQADAVVCSIPPQQLPKILDPRHVDASKLDFLGKILPTQGISIDYGLESPLTQLRSLILVNSDPFLMGFCPSNLDPGLAPHGCQLLSFLGITSGQFFKLRSTIAKMESQILKMFPGIKSKLIFKRILPLRIIDGVELNIWQSRMDRPSPDFLGIKGLFLNGDYLCAQGAGGDLAFSSALLCLNSLEKYLQDC